jgi:mannitol/fructose-specific phosphotransferase system IIA component
MICNRLQIILDWHSRTFYTRYPIHILTYERDPAVDILTQQTIRLRAEAVDKVDAIKQSGELLVSAGYVAPAYVGGMLARERVLSNYIGNGIAIPHGRSEDLKNVYHTGLSVLQLPLGVAWEPAEKAHLVIGLAAVSEEHFAILTNLVEVLREPKTIHELVHTTDPMVIIERLTRGPVAAA